MPRKALLQEHAADHGGAGRLIAQYATSIRATTIVLGAPAHGGLPALMDASASQELWRRARSNILISTRPPRLSTLSPTVPPQRPLPRAPTG